MQTQIQIPGPRARVTIHSEVAYAWDEKAGVWLRRVEVADEVVENLILDAGRVQLHKQCYATSPLTNGFNYVALSNDGAAPAAGDTTLASELSGDGLTRKQGVVTSPTGSGNQTSIAATFVYTGASQSVQKAALFTAISGGVMAHEILFTQRTLNTNGSITLTFVITMG
jgi:hypothetical protein